MKSSQILCWEDEIGPPFRTLKIVSQVIKYMNIQCTRRFVYMKSVDKILRYMCNIQLGISLGRFIISIGDILFCCQNRKEQKSTWIEAFCR